MNDGKNIRQERVSGEFRVPCTVDSHFFFFKLSKYSPRPFWTFSSETPAKNHSTSCSRFFCNCSRSAPRKICLVNALACGDILEYFNKYFSHRSNASALSLAISSTNPILCASSVENIVPSIRALSASRRDRTLRIDAWNHAGGIIPNWVSFKPM